MGAEGTFTGQILRANPIHAFNDPADRVVVEVHTEVTFHSTTMTTFGLWQTRQQVQNEQGKILGNAYGMHDIAPWTATDYASELKVIDCGKLTYSQNLKVVLAARAPAVIGAWERTAFLWIPVYVTRSQVQPAPIPPEQPVVLPVTTPVVTPADIYPDETEEAPVEEQEEQEDWWESPWLWVGVAVLGLVALAPKRKAGKG